MHALNHSTIFIQILALSLSFFSCLAIPQEALDKGFVDLHDIDPTIIISPRYYSDENFIGQQIDGYHKPVIMVTKPAADALKKVQAAVKKDGYSLVVYDAYRPQRAVDNFVQWSQDSDDQRKKDAYYPRVDKIEVFDRGYIAKRSGHSRGSTVDLTLIKDGEAIHPVIEHSRTLLDGFTILLLDDGTCDMGSSFDLFDEASHGENNLIEEKYYLLRRYLKNRMAEHGFKHYAEEWWHFTLENEPFPAPDDASYFDFAVE